MPCVYGRWNFRLFSPAPLVVHARMLTLFCLCIDKLEQMDNQFVEQVGIEEVTIKNVVIILLFYTDDVMPFANTVWKMPKSLSVYWKTFEC